MVWRGPARSGLTPDLGQLWVEILLITPDVCGIVGLADTRGWVRFETLTVWLIYLPKLLSPLQKYTTPGSPNTGVLSVINHFTKAQHNISTLRYISTETIKFPRRERDIDSLLLRRELFWYIHCWHQEVWTRTSISDHSCEAELFYDNTGDSKELNQIIILFFW